MNKLETLEVSATKVTDEGLANLEPLTNLQNLKLAETTVTDAGLAHLAGLLQLARLDLGGTQVGDRGLANLKMLAKLEDLRLSQTRVSDTDLPSLKGLKNLKRLALSGTQISDEGLSHLSGLQNLTDLELADTDITDGGLKYLLQLKNLVRLNLQNATVTLKGVEQFRRALPACSVSVTETPRLTVKLVTPARNAYFKIDTPVLLNAKTRAVGSATMGRVEFQVDGSIVATDADAPYEVTWNGGKTGHHVVTARVFNEEGEQTDSHTVFFFVGVRGLERSVTSSSDDAEENADSGHMYLDSSDLELISDTRRGDQVVGMRFADIQRDSDPQGIHTIRRQ